MGFLTYDPKKVIMTVGTIVVRGFADGEMINISYSEDRRTMHIGSSGEGRHIQGANLSGVCSFKLADYSPTNSAFQVLDDAGSEVAITIVDKTSDGAGFFAASCVVAKSPDWIRGKEAVEPEWKFNFIKGAIKHAGAIET
jgi:hypothetical protein